MGDIVYATIDGQLQSWTNSYGGEAPTAAPAAETPASSTGEALAPAPAAAEATTSPSAEASAATSTASEVSSSPSSSEAPSPSEHGSGSGDPQADLTGDWVRSGYYNSADHTLDGMVFLNNKGGQGSGVFDLSVFPPMEFVFGHC